MTQPLVLVNREQPAITQLTLNRPDKRNALNVDIMQELCDKIEETQSDTTQRVIILQGAGPVFCAGMDLLEACDPDKEENSARMVAKTLLTLYQCPLITMAAVHGAALAGGAGLMAICDFVIAAAGTRCGFPEVKRGLVPAQIAAFLFRQMRWRELRELLLCGDVFDADKAQACGLVNRIVPPGELMHAAVKWAHEILKGAPGAVKDTKYLLNQLERISVQECLDIAMPFHHKARVSEEAHEGIRAFLEKRNPVWDQ